MHSQVSVLLVDGLLGVALIVIVVGLLVVTVTLLARTRFGKESQSIHADLHEQRVDIERREHRLAEREARLDEERRQFDERCATLEEERRRIEAEVARLADVRAERTRILERVSGLSAEEARARLIEEEAAEARLQAALVVREIEREATEEGTWRARRLLSTVVQRLASVHTAETVVSTVSLPSEDMKGRIIGREGRNIRSFEQVTGTNLVIDETPDSVVISCFDPVRREMARVCLAELVEDGRIHPARIEEVYARAAAEVERLVVRAGEDACLEVGITDLHPELVATMGKLKYRTSYGQNVLRHLMESAQAAGLIADELGVDRALCVRSAFLHDLGKALTHEQEGSHALVGALLAKRYGEHPDVVHAIEAHHNEVEPRTIEAFVTQAADAISGGRPGARRESSETFAERMQALERIAKEHGGVDKVFAMSAGREVRVMVLPEEVDDLAAQVLARDIAKRYEQDLTYPGQIKVTVVRESRATETAR